MAGIRRGVGLRPQIPLKCAETSDGTAAVARRLVKKAFFFGGQRTKLALG